jgi:hypothetical protein
MIGTSSALLAAVGGLLIGGLAPARGGLAITRTVEQGQQPTTVTGCLAKGKDKDSYTIKGSDGKSYSLTSSTVQLGEHVGHTVTVTGSQGAVETGALKDTGMKKDTSMKNAGAAHDMGAGSALTVTNLKMVSAQCK